MIGRKIPGIGFCLALTVFILLAGCSSLKDQSYVADDAGFTTYTETTAADSVASESGAKVYLDDSDAETTSYVSRYGEFVRITPAPPPASESKEVLTPLEAEFKAAKTPELLAAFVDKYAPAELAFVALQRLAGPEVDVRNWSAAVELYGKYQGKFPDFNERIKALIAILKAPEENLRVVNLGGGINSAAGEYNPVISSDGRKIYFARDCGECGGGEEVFVARRDGEGNWGKASRFGEPLSSRGHEIPLGIAADGNTLAVYGHYDGSLGNGDIFFVEKTKDGWGALQHYPAPINSENFESNAMYTADGKAMLFVSDRPGGVGDYHPKGTFFNGNYAGNTDIYVYVAGADGNGQIINLGPVVNTPFSEYSPYLHPDGKTLYFSSDGQAGLGDLDVFKVTRLNDTSWTEWSEPVNLGKEINTSSNDWGYQVAAAGEDAFFAKSSLLSSYGASDIFSIGLPQKAKPSGVITISGVVTDPNGDALVADIRWDDLEAQKEIGSASSDPITGEYLLHLPYGGNYGYYADKPGYIGESEHFDLRAAAESYKEYVLDIVLYPIVQPVEMVPEPIGAVPAIAEIVAPVVDIRMNNIFFAFDKSDLQSESFMEMKRWIKMLEENPHVNLHVSGHTDSVGSDAYNQKLSERRARAVIGYLTDNGIGAERLVAEGLGESQPVASNDTEAGRQQNRRVQVQILSQGK